MKRTALVTQERSDAFKDARERAKKERIFHMNTSASPASFREGCIVYMDLMGASYAYATSLETPLNALLRINAAVAQTLLAFPEALSYQFADSHYFTFEDASLAFRFAINLCHQILIANSLLKGWCFGHFLLPRITIATGHLFEGRRSTSAAGSMGGDAANAVLGPGILSAYRLEKRCAPLGVLFAADDAGLLAELQKLSLNGEPKTSRLLRQFCTDQDFRRQFQRNRDTISFPWFLFSAGNLVDVHSRNLAAATTEELISKFDILHLILHRFWHEYRMDAHRMPAPQVIGLPKGKRKKGQCNTI
jgi:hypothetical protein